MTANMYRVGDYVYFETSSSSPYQIRRIEELNKTPNGNVEAKVMCFYRRRDISSSLIVLADKHQAALEEESENYDEEDDLSECQRHQLKHKELFLSRQVETLPATHIRGKCSVTLLNETESLTSYLNSEDTFFYSLVYDPQQKTLLADRGEIRVGSRFQAESQALLKPGDDDGRDLNALEKLVWSSESGGLSDRQIDQFLVIARSVGTFARALDCTSTVRQPSLHMSAAAASRDVTLLHAMDTLHKHSYDLSKAVSSLVPPGGPVLCRDEMEEWSASEANLFEEALDKYGKDFTDIRQDFLPWKSLKSIVEYYYMWKTTDRYVQQKRIKAAEAETKLKQVYIPSYKQPNPAQINRVNGVDPLAQQPCESCQTLNSTQWYQWGGHMQYRLCLACWNYWKKSGGLKSPSRIADHDGVERVTMPHRQERLANMAPMRSQKCTISGCGKEFKVKAQLARHLANAHGMAIRSGSPRPIMKTRAAFCLITTTLTRISRQVCADLLNIRKAARLPFSPIDVTTIKTQCQSRLPHECSKVKELLPFAKKPMNEIVSRLGIDVTGDQPYILRPSEGSKLPAKIFFPKPDPEHAVPLPNFDRFVPQSQPSIMRKRGFEQANGIDGGPVSKKQSQGVIRQTASLRSAPPQIMVRDTVINQLNGRTCHKGLINNRPRKTILSWMDAPEDVYFFATDVTRKLRKQLTSCDFRRAARKPWRELSANRLRSGKTEGI